MKLDRVAHAIHPALGYHAHRRCSRKAGNDLQRGRDDLGRTVRVATHVINAGAFDDHVLTVHFDTRATRVGADGELHVRNLISQNIERGAEDLHKLTRFDRVLVQRRDHCVGKARQHFELRRRIVDQPKRRQRTGHLQRTGSQRAKLRSTGCHLCRCCRGCNHGAPCIGRERDRLPVFVDRLTVHDHGRAGRGRGRGQQRIDRKRCRRKLWPRVTRAVCSVQIDSVRCVCLSVRRAIGRGVRSRIALNIRYRDFVRIGYTSVCTRARTACILAAAGRERRTRYDEQAEQRLQA